MNPIDIITSAKCLIFDFDGVLIESEAIKEDGFHYLFRGFPDKKAAVSAYLSENPSIPRTIRIPALYRIVCGRELDEQTMTSLSNQFSAYVHDRVRECPEILGARDLLETLHGTRPIYVSSATPEPELLAICEDRSFSQYLDGIYGAPVTKPEHIAAICQKHDISPSDCLFIGDSPADHKAAQAAGTQFLARTSTVNIDHLDCQKIPDFVYLFKQINSGSPSLKPSASQLVS